MEPMKIEEIRSAVDGIIVQGNPSAQIDSISIDSRSLNPGELFVAIIGERFDGHSFINDAVNKGAKALIVDRSIKAYPGIAIIRVKNTTRALQDLASYNRQRYSNLEVIGVTGSVGKTTTKDMIASILQQIDVTLKSKGNFNNYYGLPLSLLSLSGKEKYAVLEMAMSNLGEIKRLTEISSPRIGVVTNVGPAHLKNLENVANVAEAKKELIEGLPQDGVAILNYDNQYVREMEDSFQGKEVIYYGLKSKADIYAFDINTDENNKEINFKVRYDDSELQIKLNKPGKHNIYNALAAIAVARVYNISWKSIKKGLINLNLSSLRLDIREINNITVINDTYNANPLSMKAGINVLNDIAQNRTIAVLGDMLELGPEEERAHYKIGKFVAKKNVDLLITVGKLATIIASGAEDNGLTPEKIFKCETNKQVVNILNNNLQENDTVLLKGSRKMKMENIVEMLEA